MDSCEKISNSITAAKELIENETRSLAALHKAKQLEKYGCLWYDKNINIHALLLYWYSSEIS